jgi:hypothetical protein
MVNQMKNHFDMTFLRAFVQFMGPGQTKEHVREQAEDILGRKTGSVQSGGD